MEKEEAMEAFRDWVVGEFGIDAINPETLGYALKYKYQLTPEQLAGLNHWLSGFRELFAPV